MSADSHIVVSIVVPLEEDAAILEPFLEELSVVLRQAYLYYEIILIDDASKDDTADRMGRLLDRFDRVRFLRLSRNFGREVAISAGLETAVGDFVVVMMANEDPPSLVPIMVEKCRQSKGIVFGISRVGKPRGLLAQWAAERFRRYAREQVGVKLHENATDFWVLSRQAVNAIVQVRDRNRSLRIAAAMVGYAQEPLVYDLLNRKGRRRHIGFLQEASQALEIAVANSRHPLRLVSRLGLCISGLNGLYMAYIVAIYLFKRKVAEGWTTVSLQNTTMFFFLFLILAILSEYIGRILEETQIRPHYLIADEQRSRVVLEDEMKRNIVKESTDV